VIVAGDVDPEFTLTLVEKHFGSWQRKDYQVDVPVEPPQKAAKYEHLKWDAPTVPYLLAGWHAPAFDADRIELPALTLLGELYFGETSPLYQKLVVKEQLVDQFAFEVPNNRDPGLFELYIRLTKPENTAPVVAAIQDALVKARTSSWTRPSSRR
jgi:zinc protease